MRVYGLQELFTAETAEFAEIWKGLFALVPALRAGTRKAGATRYSMPARVADAERGDQ